MSLVFTFVVDYVVIVIVFNIIVVALFVVNDQTRLKSKVFGLERL